MPIRVRLALWYSTIFGSALLVIGIALYFSMAQHLQGMVDDAVANRTRHLVTAMHSANERATKGSTAFLTHLDDFESPGVLVQILAPDGTTLDRSSNLNGRDLPLPRGTALQAHEGGYSASLDGVDMKVSLAPVIVEGRTRAWVQVAVTYENRDRMLSHLTWVLIGGGLGAVVVAGLLSAAMAGRALKPVSEMTETARAIALSQGFGRRLKAGNANDELGQLARTFNEMLASLEGAYSAQKRFTADASHELRGPLTAIRGNLDLLDRVKDMPEVERQQTLKQVLREVVRLSRLVGDLLALARADAGQTLQARPVELDDLLVDVHRQAVATANGVSVRLDHVEPAVIQGDEDRLKELLLILVDNALRYTPQEGTVALWVKKQAPWVTVGVEDTGIGIEPEDLPHIFDRFWRADRARSRDRGGTGLGLAIAKWIVDRHGGEILVDSLPRKGTRFSVRLPASS